LFYFIYVGIEKTLRGLDRRLDLGLVGGNVRLDELVALAERQDRGHVFAQVLVGQHGLDLLEPALKLLDAAEVLFGVAGRLEVVLLGLLFLDWKNIYLFTGIIYYLGGFVQRLVEGLELGKTGGGLFGSLRGLEILGLLLELVDLAGVGGELGEELLVLAVLLLHRHVGVLVRLVLDGGLLLLERILEILSVGEELLQLEGLLELLTIFKKRLE